MVLIALQQLPAVMGEGFVGFRHPVRILTLFDSGAAIVGGIEEFARKAFDHCVLRALARQADNPPNRQGLAAQRAHLYRHLIGRTADATGTNF
jgi:hypothetical protein